MTLLLATHSLKGQVQLLGEQEGGEATGHPALACPHGTVPDRATKCEEAAGHQSPGDTTPPLSTWGAHCKPLKMPLLTHMTTFIGLGGAM